MITNKGEAQFSRWLTKRKMPWVHHPHRIDGYQPDFYVPVSNTYYEVIGSRQALHQNHLKVSKIIREHPEIKLLLVRPSGQKISYRIESGKVFFETPTGHWTRFRGKKLSEWELRIRKQLRFLTAQHKPALIRFDGKQVSYLRKFLRWNAGDTINRARLFNWKLRPDVLDRWERGKTIPDANNLSNLAALFGVGIERFYSEQ